MVRYDYYDEFDYDDNGSDCSDVPKDKVKIGGTAPTGRSCGPKEGPVHELGKVLGTAPLFFDSFVLSGKADWFPGAPGLVIHGAEAVGVPIVSAAQAERLATVWDAPGQVRCDNPEWNKAVGTAIERVATYFGLTGTSIAASLAALRLSKKGDKAVFAKGLKVRNTHFATLAIQLPSECTGGQLRVRHVDNQRGCTVALGSDADEANLAFYAVRHADSQFYWEPPTDGYRLVIEYALCWPQEKVAEAPTVTLSATLLNSVVEQLTVMEKGSRRIELIFDENYDDSAIAQYGSRALRGKDRSIFNILQAASARMGDAGYVFYIGTATRSAGYSSSGRSFKNAQWGKEPWEDMESIHRLHELNGTVFKKLSTNFTCGLQGQSTLNPYGKSLNALWHGVKITSYGFDEEGFVDKSCEWQKHMLIGWPKRRDGVERICAQGLVASYAALVETKPKPAAVADYLKSFAEEAKRCRDISTRNCERAAVLRGLFTAIVTQPALHYLMPEFLNHFPSSADILSLEPTEQRSIIVQPMDANTFNHDGLKSFVKLLAVDSLWNNEVVRAKILSAFTDRTEHLTLVLEMCLNDRMAPKSWRPLLDLLVQSIIKSAAQVSSNVLQRRLWRVAIEVIDPALCRALVAQQIKLSDKASVLQSVADLKEQHRLRPTLFATKHPLVNLIFKAHQKISKQQFKDLPPALPDFRYPNAVSAKPRLQAFLRGPEKTFQVWADHEFKRDDIEALRKAVWSHGTSVCKATETHGLCLSLTKSGWLASEATLARNKIKAEFEEVKKLMDPPAASKNALQAWSTKELNFHWKFERDVQSLMKLAEKVSDPLLPESQASKPVAGDALVSAPKAPSTLVLPATASPSASAGTRRPADGQADQLVLPAQKKARVA